MSNNVTFWQLVEYTSGPQGYLNVLGELYLLNDILTSGFSGLGVACWPLVPEFVGSNPAEAVAFLRAKKSSARLPSEGK